MIVTTDAGEITVKGEILGSGTSWKQYHDPRVHEPDQFADRHTRCSACRWTNITILYDADDEEYILVKEGKSAVPGERTFGQVQRTASPAWLVNIMHNRSRDANAGERYIPLVSRQALIEAGEVDSAIASILTEQRIDVT